MGRRGAVMVGQGGFPQPKPMVDPQKERELLEKWQKKTPPQKDPKKA